MGETLQVQLQPSSPMQTHSADDSSHQHLLDPWLSHLVSHALLHPSATSISTLITQK